LSDVKKRRLRTPTAQVLSLAFFITLKGYNPSPANSFHTDIDHRQTEDWSSMAS